MTTSENLRADVVVVGGGLNGAAAAYYLTEFGMTDVVVVAGTKDDRSASWDSVGLLRTHYDNVPESELAVASMPMFDHWRTLSTGDDGWLDSGFLRFVGPDEVDVMRANAQIQESLGVKLELMSPAEIGQRFPYFSLDGIGGALYEPNSGTADAWIATTSLLRVAAQAGATVLKANATTLHRDASGITGVTTADGTHIECRTVVLAAGAWATQLAATVELDLQLESKLITQAEVTLPAELAGMPSYMDPVSDSWLTPRKGGTGRLNVRSAETGAVIDPDAEIPPVPSDCFAEGLGRVAQRVPSLSAATVRRGMHTLDTYAPDGKPVLGPVESVPGLLLSVGGAGKGHKVAPAIAWALDASAAGADVPVVDLSPFAPERFSRGGFPASGTPYLRRTIG